MYEGIPVLLQPNVTATFDLRAIWTMLEIELA
jgi:hypothetical protein